MSRITKTLEQLFSTLLLTYPKTYREEFGLETQSVFRQIITDAAKQGTFQLTLVMLREIRDYPRSIIREHWRNYHQKEAVMVANTPSITVAGCPRCGSIKETEARYCPNCGRAFIPFKDKIIERVKYFINDKLLRRVIDASIFFIPLIILFIELSKFAADRILFHGFHPATNVIVIIGLAVLSFIAGRRLYGDASNFKKLRALLIIAVITLVFFNITSDLDMLYLRSTLTGDNPVSYKFLDSETYVTYVEEKQDFYSDIITTAGHNRMIWQIYRYLPPYDKRDRGDPAITSNGYDTYPAIMIERSWPYFRDTYKLFLMVFIAAFSSAGFFAAKRKTKKSLV